MSARGALRGLATLVLNTATASAVAASFGLSPLGLSVKPGETSVSVVVTNTGTDAVVLQTRAYAWSQDGQEARADTRDLILNPPIFKLGAGEQQLVRLAPRIAPLADTERAYRVVFSEVPTPTAAPQSGFRITVAMDIPVYLEPAQPATPDVHWWGERNMLVIENRGGRHYRLREVQLLDGSTVVHGLARLVVLARSRLQIELPDAAARVRSLRLIGQDGADQPVSIDIPVASAQ